MQTILDIIPEEDRKLVELIHPDFENGPWICGGACINWLQNTPVPFHSDVDVYFKNSHEHKEFINRMCASDEGDFKYRCEFDSTNATTFTITNNDKKWKVQAIRLYYNDTIFKVLNAFDIDACKIGLGRNEFVFGSDNTKEHILNKILYIPKLKTNSISRVVKYMIKGYDLTEETYELMFNSDNNLTTDFDYDPNKEYSEK